MRWVFFAGGILLEILAFMSQVAPEDIASNLARWVTWSGAEPPKWLNAPNADIWIGIGAGLFGAVLLVAYFLWPRLRTTVRSTKSGSGFGQAPQAKAPAYLRDRDTELSTAIYLMVLYSAWGRWFAAQAVGPRDERYLMMTASHLVTEAAMNGNLEIRGRRNDEVVYTSIPREYWRLAYLAVNPDSTTLWRVSIKPRADVKDARIAAILSYDSLLVNSKQFENLWPRAKRLELFRRALQGWQATKWRSR